MTNLQTKSKACVRHSKHVQFGPANTGNKSPLTEQLHSSKCTHTTFYKNTLKKKFYINNKNAYNSTTKAFLYLFILENTFKSCKSIVTGRVLIHTA